MPKTKDLKLPPQDIDAEQSVLGAIMIDKDAIFSIADILTPSDFYKKAHCLIYEAILKLWERHEPIDILSVAAELRKSEHLKEVGGSAYLTELVNSVPTSSHILHYGKIVKEKRILRELINASAEIAENAFHPEDDLENILDLVEQRIFSISQQGTLKNFVPISEELKGAYERIEKMHHGEDGKLRGVPTGFTDLDRMLSGLQKSDLTIVGARPSYGKTAFVLDIARNAAVKFGQTVGVFSLEMSREQVIDRLIAAEAQVDLWKLRTGRLKDELEFEMIQTALDKLSNAPLFIDDTPSPNIVQMRSMARRLQVEHKSLGLLVVDYLQLIQPRTNYESVVQQVTEISRGLKGLARELAVPIVAVSQLSRAVDQREGRLPRLSDLRESGCLAGDTVIMRADTGELIPIEKLVGQTNIPVHSLDEDFQIKEKMISKVFCSGEKMVYELKTRSGFAIKASANHPFWKINGWTRLEELKVGDRIATAKELKISAPKNELSEDEIIFLAHLLGDGCILPRQPYHYTSADWNNIQVVGKTAKKLFGIEPKIVKQKNWWHVYLTCPYRLTHRIYHPITKWFESLSIKRVLSFEKEIPQKVFSLSKEKIALFLKHLWATDGHIGYRQFKKRGGKPGSELGTIYYASTSQKLAQSVKYLLLRFGIRSKIKGAKKGNYRICYQVWIDGARHQKNFLENIGSFGARGRIVPEVIEKLKKIKPNTNLDTWPKEIWQFIINPIREEQNISWRDFSAGIDTAYCGTTLFKHGIGTERIQRIAKYLQSPIVDNMAKADIFWDEIISIKQLETEKVYDATVPGPHNFVANGIIVENSIEQDADIVLFLHPKDNSRSDVSLDEQNIVDIIVAKHRNGPTGSVNLYFDKQKVSFFNVEKRDENSGSY